MECVELELLLHGSRNSTGSIQKMHQFSHVVVLGNLEMLKTCKNSQIRDSSNLESSNYALDFHDMFENGAKHMLTRNFIERADLLFKDGSPYFFCYGGLRV